VNRQIARLGVGFLVLYTVLFVQLNRVQVFQAPDLRDDPGNSRSVVREFGQARGSITTADGVLVAQSVEVDDLRSELASKQDVAMLRPVRVDEILSQRCERCHTDRRFAALAGMSEPEVLETIQRMRSHPGADIPAAYHDFVRNGDARQIGLIVKHNQWDLVTMVHLLERILRPRDG